MRQIGKKIRQKKTFSLFLTISEDQLDDFF